MAIRKMAAPSRMPKMKVANGSHAVMGMGRSPCPIGFSLARTNPNQPNNPPKVTAKTDPIAKPTNPPQAAKITESHQLAQFPRNPQSGPKNQFPHDVTTLIGEGT